MVHQDKKEGANLEQLRTWLRHRRISWGDSAPEQVSSEQGHVPARLLCSEHQDHTDRSVARRLPPESPEQPAAPVPGSHTACSAELTLPGRAAETVLVTH